MNITYNSSAFNATAFNTTAFNTTAFNATAFNATAFNDSSILSNDESESDFPIEEILWVIILLGTVVSGCCLGCYVCYKENKQTQEWANWVRFKKNGGVLPM